MQSVSFQGHFSIPVKGQVSSTLMEKVIRQQPEQNEAMQAIESRRHVLRWPGADSVEIVCATESDDTVRAALQSAIATVNKGLKDTPITLQEHTQTPPIDSTLMRKFVLGLHAPIDGLIHRIGVYIPAETLQPALQREIKMQANLMREPSPEEQEKAASLIAKHAADWWTEQLKAHNRFPKAGNINPKHFNKLLQKLLHPTVPRQIHAFTDKQVQTFRDTLKVLIQEEILNAASKPYRLNDNLVQFKVDYSPDDTLREALNTAKIPVSNFILPNKTRLVCNAFGCHALSEPCLNDGRFIANKEPVYRLPDELLHVFQER